MRPLADHLSEREAHGARWVAGAPGSLTPSMRVQGESSLPAIDVRDLVIGHLRNSPPAWNPYPV